MRHSIAVHPLHSELNSTGHAPFLAHGRLNKLGILAVKFTCHTPRCEKLFYSKEIWVFFFFSSLHSACSPISGKLRKFRRRKFSCSM